MRDLLTQIKKHQLLVIAGVTVGLLALPLLVVASRETTQTQIQAQVVSGNHYYVDCVAGNDANDGLSEATAWKTLTKANAASLIPGDSLLLKRGCTWTGSLQAKWNGTETSPITIGAYGTGDNPIIESNVNNTELVAITGSYLTIENLYTRGITFRVDAACGNTPLGYILGFSFKPGSHHNTLRSSKATGTYAGVFIQGGTNPSHHNKILSNQLVDNTMMEPLDRTAWNDAGAFGVLLWGDDNEIAHNIMARNIACSYDYGTDGAAVELYGGQRNFIHHNKSFNDESFVELGSPRTQDTTLAYNEFYSTNNQGAFLVTRGAQDGDGPAWRTKAYNNTAYMTGPETEGVVCYAGCSSEILSFRNNIIKAGLKDAYSDAPFDEDYNIFGGTVQQLAGGKGAHSKITNPLFVNPGLQDLHLQATSPARDAGIELGLGYLTDLDGNAVPQGTAPDMGAYEYGTATTPTGTPTGTTTPTDGPTGTPTTIPSPTPTPTTVSPTPTRTPTPVPPTPTRTPTPSPTPVGATNLLKNNSFEAGLSPWTFRTTSPVTGSAAVATDSKYDGIYAAKINITKASSNTWYAQFRQDGLTLTAGKTYTITFWARASSNRAIDHVIQLANSPYTTRASKSFNLTTTWQKFTYSFTAPANNTNVFYGFNVAKATGSIWIDNASFTSN